MTKPRPKSASRGGRRRKTTTGRSRPSVGGTPRTPRPARVAGRDAETRTRGAAPETRSDSIGEHGPDRTPSAVSEHGDVGQAPEGSGISLRASSRFWLIVLGAVLAGVALIQGYGNFTGWGDVEKVVARHFNRAQRLTLAKRSTAALKAYEKILSMDVGEEHHRQAMIAMADLLRERQEWSRAIELYRRLRSRQPDDILAAWAGLQIADVQLQTGRLDEAFAQFLDISRRYPDSDWDAEARLGMGKVREQQERYDEAVTLYRQIVGRYAGGFLAAEALVRIGQCREFQGRNEAAKQAYREVIESYPPGAQDKARIRLRRLEAGKEGEGVRWWGDGNRQ